MKARPDSLSDLAGEYGFEVVDIFGVWNSYPLDYWLSLAPLPQALKSPVLAFLKASRLGRWPLRANFGNMGLVARKT